MGKALSDYPEHFTAVDIELANSDLHSICEVGVAKFRFGDLVETWRVLVNPEADFETLYHSDLHGIREHHIRGAATFPDIHLLLKRFIAEETCVFHASGNFDPNCIGSACKRYGLDDITQTATWMSTLDLARHHWPGEPSYKQERLCVKIGHDYQPHNALEDAIACAAIYRALQGSNPQPAIAAAGTATDHQRTFRRVSSAKRGTGLKGSDEGPFAGIHIVFTGNFAPPWDDRSAFEQYLCSLGFTPRSNISGKTKMLVTGEGAGPKKIADAHTKGIEVMTEVEFLNYIQSSGPTGS
jgi:DNA polymerase-3 subunit epsilon